jgi:hypothetical protein
MDQHTIYNQEKIFKNNKNNTCLNTGIIDSGGANTTGLGGNAWIVEHITGRTVGVAGYLRKTGDEENPNPAHKKVAGTLTENDDEKIKSRNEKFNTPCYHADQIKENGTILIEPGGTNKARLVYDPTPTSGKDTRLIII